MKKALTITIGGILFTIEEDAYEKLKAYLDSVKAYFSSYNDAEIINDIEARIAEQLIGKKDAVLGAADIDQLIAVMGRVEDFKESESGSFASSEEKSEYRKTGPSATNRRLYRDADNPVIFGVASGMAYFFGIDPLIVRLCFIILTLITQGAGLLIYIILALLVPKAVTPAEKVQMRGGPIDLNSFRETVRDQVNNVKKNGRELIRESRVRNFLEGTIAIIGRIIKLALRALAVIIGIGLMVASVGAFLAATFAFMNLTLNRDSQAIEFPLAQVLSGPSYYLLITLGYLLIIVPLVFILALAIYCFKRKNIMPLKAGLVIAGTWLITLLAFGTLLIRILPVVDERIKALPQNQIETSTETLSGFDKLALHGIDTVHITQSPTFSISESGRPADIERTRFEVQDGTLVLTQTSRKKPCYFCTGRKPVDIVVGMPSVQEIKTSGIVRVTSDAPVADKLSLAITDASQADITVDTKEIMLRQNGIARTTLIGTTTSLRAELDNASRLDISRLTVGTSSIQAEDASRVTAR